MEIQKRLSACWQSFTKCFKKSESSGGETRTVSSPVVIVNHGAKDKTEPSRPLPPLPLSPTPDRELYVALYDYSARTEEDISFNAGDTLEALDKSAGEWWYALALNGLSANKKGYIPANYVAPVESIESEP